ncbi:hypothetical protein RIR_e46162_A0A2N0NR29_9GLOM [Rhizophagus irregularis DAOM 181602=DAOM 197198]|nr:hypothetical protein RIR_e46162_A0A2N0NR29_9GLOM [Rhizophagus irregularis DAOM 181602=DAOM 197198]
MLVFLDVSQKLFDVHPIVAVQGKYKSLDDFEPDDLEEQYHVFKVMTLLLFLIQEELRNFETGKIRLSQEEFCQKIRKIIDSIEISVNNYYLDYMLTFFFYFILTTLF